LPALEDASDAPLDAVSRVAVAYVPAFAAVLPAFARLALVRGKPKRATQKPQPAPLAATIHRGA
jgi:hypothetical protein